MNIDGVFIDFLGHSGFLIKVGNKRIAIDPYNVNRSLEKVDIILITHPHQDHCSIKDIDQLSKPNTTIIVPADCQSKVMKIKDINLKLITLGKKLDLDEIIIETFPAYNINKPFHEKSESWLGYIIHIGKTIIYHAGDTDKIPEFSSLSKYSEKNKFIAILPVSREFAMTAEEAADAASIINPSIAIPMHYGAGVAGTQTDAERFVELCSNKGINARVLNKL
ncbi:MAG TPA: MBL fold metallo-hydrolase [Candidatus Paceibacterota bacterium]|nr:MBL fold metallo-hydrolase [Candidatus Paceibacterota bacterium]